MIQQQAYSTPVLARRSGVDSSVEVESVVASIASDTRNSVYCITIPDTTT